MLPLSSGMSSQRGEIARQRKRRESIGKRQLAALPLPASAFFGGESKRWARLAASLGLPPQEMEDVLQEAWLEFARCRYQSEGADAERRLRSWWKQVVHSKAVDARRRLDSHPWKSLAAEVELIDCESAKRAEAAELEEWLHVLLEKGSVGDGENIRLLRGHYLQGQSLKELAEESGLRECAVEGRIRRTLKKLLKLAE